MFLIHGSALFFIAQLVYFVWLVPTSSDKPIRTHSFDKPIGTLAYAVAYALSLLRLPFVVFPYLSKMLFFLIFRTHYKRFWNSYFFQGLGIAGDFVNLALVPSMIGTAVSVPEGRLLWALLQLSTMAECIRLLSEKGPMIGSALWQTLPHRAIARALMQRRIPVLSRYVRYYSLDDDERMQYILCALKSLASADADVSARLEYMRAFRVVNRSNGLRCDKVRDVARGEVFIHRNWTSDPWLLIGQAMRRAPWMFDPRYLRRPFYYRTESNRLATLFVLQHARYSPPYAWYQFGHEIKAARYDFMVRLLRWLRLDIEEPVREDGAYRFDRLIGWLEKRMGYARVNQRPLWSDEEVIADVLKANGYGQLSPMDIALRYTYPLKYVEEVLLDTIQAAQSQPKASLTTAATPSAASQWG